MISFDISLERNDVVVVDCTHPSCPTITHHKGHQNFMQPSLADSSTGLVLAALADCNFGPQLDRFAYCTVNHYDVDAFLAVFCLLHPSLAMQYAKELGVAAHIGDFREIAPRNQTMGKFDQIFGQHGAPPLAAHILHGMKLVCWLRMAESQRLSKPYETKDSRSKFNYFLDKFPHILVQPDSVHDEWLADWNDVVNSLHCLECPSSVALDHVEAVLMEGCKSVLQPLLRPVHVDAASSPTISSSANQPTHVVPPSLPPLGPLDRVLFVPYASLGIVFAPEPLHYDALFSATMGCDTLATVYPGQRYELEQKYTQFVEYWSRPVTARIDLGMLAGVLNEREAWHRGQTAGPSASVASSSPLDAAAGRGKATAISTATTTSHPSNSSHATAAVPPAPPPPVPWLNEWLWTATRFTDSGPILRLDAAGRPLSKMERYGNPRDRPHHPSAIPTTEWLALVSTYLAHGLSYAPPPRPGGFSWAEAHALQKAIAWQEWMDLVREAISRAEQMGGNMDCAWLVSQYTIQ